MSESNHKRIAWTVAVLVLAASSVGVYRFRAPGRQPAVRYETSKVDRGRVVAKVTATGTVSAIVTVQVGSQVSGTILQLFADFNSQVRKGQLVAKLDPRLFSQAFEQARANLAAARSNLVKARAQQVNADLQYERQQRLAAEKIIAQEDLDTAESNARVARAQTAAAAAAVEQAQAALHQAATNLAYTTIVSPIDGIVVSRNVDVGQTVAASLQAPVLFQIAQDLRRMQVDTSVAEADVGKLTEGMPASFTVDAFPGKAFKGIVRQIRNAPQLAQNVVTYDAVIDVGNPNLELRPGMTANATFVYAERADATRVANAALRFHPAAGLGFPPAPAPTPAMRAAPGAVSPAAAAPGAAVRSLWVLRGGKPALVTVATGITDGTFTELLAGGLNPGDTVIDDAAAAGKAKFF
jgi:HlyD family secretion protein